MHEPRRIDIPKPVVQRAEDESSNHKTNEHQRKRSRMEHPDHHTNVVKGEKNGAEKCGEFCVHKLFERYKHEASEEELLEERIHHRYVKRYPQKVVRRDAHTLGQARGNSSEINESAREKVSADDHCINTECEKD